MQGWVEVVPMIFSRALLFLLKSSAVGAFVHQLQNDVMYLEHRYGAIVQSVESAPTYPLKDGN